MPRTTASLLCLVLIVSTLVPAQQAAVAAEQVIEQKFLAVPDARLAEEHLRTLTIAPHIAGSPEDRKTAEYVAQKFREAGLETEIVEYSIWMNLPQEISVDILYPKIARRHAPRPEHVAEDPFQDDPRVTPAFNGYSPSGDVEAEVVYANYGRPEDFKRLEEMKVEVKGKIVLVRYGKNYRGVKSYVAQQHGAAGVIIYSDPIDDGYFKGDVYPAGPWRPETAVQRGSVLYNFIYPGDPTTPGTASTSNAERVPPEKAASLPRIPTTPLSYGDASAILEYLEGKASPREWQGALPFTYHVGPGPVRVKMHLKQDYRMRAIWDVIGTIRGRQSPDEWVVGGNHRDAWVYGAVDPNSGTAAMLESVHGLGELLKSGWKPKRTIVIGSWDAEEEGLIGSTEWGEQHERELAKAVAYFNMDVAVSGPNFTASAVPSLKQYLRDLAKDVPGPGGASVYADWRKQKPKKDEDSALGGGQDHPPNAPDADVRVGDLGSGSDYVVFLQRLGVPSADVSSSGDYGVYHSAFDDFTWFKKFGDPNFLYEQQMARYFGLELLRMADTHVLPYDYAVYGREIGVYLETAQKKADAAFPAQKLDFSAAQAAAKRLAAAGSKIASVQSAPPADAAALNQTLREAERAFLMPSGLPNRPWYRHAIYAPGEYTGYAAVVIPGVNEGVDAGDRARAERGLADVTDAINRVAGVLESYQGQ